ncbi:membrane protein [Ktedonobacteria bacterium brp13]|nr:membrane protein [Ktedonobacteria bacterium brp13]
MQRFSHVLEAMRSWWLSIIDALRKAIQIDVSNTTALRAVPSVIGFGIPMILAVATNHIEIGISIAGGAVTIGTVGLAEPQHTRKKTMLLACLGIAFSAFVGSITSRLPWLSVVVTGLWGFGAGILVAFDMSALVVGLQSVIALIILSHFMLDPVPAVLQASLMLVGALFQVLLTLIPIPGTEVSLERTALANVYTALADYAADPPNEQRSVQVRTALTNAQKIIVRGNLNSPYGALLGTLFEQAERIRLDTLIFRRWRKQILALPGDYMHHVTNLDNFLKAVAEQLYSIADELRHSRSFIKRRKSQYKLKESLAVLRKQIPVLEEAHNSQDLLPLLKYSELLRDHLHTVRKLAGSLNGGLQHIRRLSLPKPNLLQRHSAWRILKANLTFRSAVFRHAVRMGFTLALATALYRVVPIPWPNGYWIPLTALLILRPDFNTTFSRGIARLIGTMLGALLTTLLVSLIAPTPFALAFFTIIAAYLGYSVLFVNYALFSLFFAVVVICLLSFVIPYPEELALDRTIDTVIGGLLALLIYVVWPTWERVQAPTYLSDLIEAVRHYCIAVLRSFIHTSLDERLELYHREARLARSNVEALVMRSQLEPRAQRIDIDLTQGIFSVCITIIDSTISLEAYLQADPDHSPMPELAPIADTLDEALWIISSIVREEDNIQAFPDVQQIVSELKSAQNLEAIKLSHVEDRSVIKSEQHFIFSNVKWVCDAATVLYLLVSHQQRPEAVLH